MKKCLVALLLTLAAAACFGQQNPGDWNPVEYTDWNHNQSATPYHLSMNINGAHFTAGTGAPSASCSVGDVYLRKDGGAGTTVYGCTATNTWSAFQAVSGNADTVTNGVYTTTLPTLADALLSETASVDLNSATAATLYTCPSGKTCIVTKVAIRNASTSLTTASVSVGWNSTSFNNVVADATHTELTGSTLYTVLAAKTGATAGTSTGVLKLKANTLQGGAATATVDVFGFIF